MILQELVLACCHTTNILATSPIVQMLLYVAKENLNFSRVLLRESLVISDASFFFQIQFFSNSITLIR